MNKEGALFGAMIALARMGFNVVPRVIMHETKGLGLLYMNKDGLRFEPMNSSEIFEVTWDGLVNHKRNP